MGRLAHGFLHLAHKCVALRYVGVYLLFHEATPLAPASQEIFMSVATRIRSAILLGSFATHAVLSAGCYVSLGKTQTSPGLDHGIVVEKTITLESENGEFKRLYITSPVRDVPVIIEVGGDRVLITAKFASDSESSIRAFAKDSSHHSEGSDLSLHIGGFLYECQSYRAFGKRSVKGVCIDEITVRLPSLSKTVVYVNGMPLSPPTEMSYQEFWKLLEHASFDEDRLSIVSIFVTANQSKGRFITTAETLRTLKAMAFDTGRVEVAELLSGHVIDRENAYKAAEVMGFRSNQMKVVELLSR